MQFLKFEGLIADKKWAAENDNSKVFRERARKIASKTDTFNLHHRDKIFFFVFDIYEDNASIGIFTDNTNNTLKLAAKYLKAIGIKLEETALEEITFATFRNFLRIANRNNFITSDDELLEQNELYKLARNTVSFDENLLTGRNKKEIYEEADRFFARDTFVPELDRIYSKNAKHTIIGHPVHYIIQTDDTNTRKEMYRLLLEALIANNRLRNKRYMYLDFTPGEDICIEDYEYLYKSCKGGSVIVRYSGEDTSNDNYADSGIETIKILCETMKKYCNQVLTVFCLPRECTKAKAFFYENLGSTSIVELKEEFVYGERAESFLKMLAKTNKIRTDKNLFAKIEENKGYLAPDLHNLFDEWYNLKLKTSIYPQYKDIACVKREVAKAAPKGSAYSELNEMIGLAEAKKVINQALNYYKAQKLFAEKGMKTDHPSMHMVFTGNPGTAKTSVARLFAEIMKENNLLSKGNLIEVGRGDLVGKYVGWTAPTIQKKFKEARGSVLFIDEAYSLVDDRDGSYGDEAINTIVQEMENHRDDVVVIFAGYPDKMESFLQKNPGLRSRIAYHVPFDDYNSEELCDISTLIANKKGLTLTEDALTKLNMIFENARTQSDFGNGRFARNIIEKAKMAQATRLLAMDFDSIKSSDITTICAEDIELPVTNANTETRRIGFCA